MTHSRIRLPEVDQVKITVVVDNSIDLLMAGTEIAQRFRLRTNPFDHLLPIAEHGFSVLLDVQQGDKRGRVLFDTGVTRNGLLYNLDALEIDAHDVQAIVLSHGHADHAMGLPGLVDRLGSRNLPLVLHPDAYLERKLVLPSGTEIHVPPPKKSDFRQESIEIIEEVGPSMLVGDMVLVSGEVERTTEFEKGFAIHYSKRNGAWQHDPLIMDDQCAIVNVKGKGLAIVTGCGHSGIINIIRHAQNLTGIQNIAAVVGGFHLTGSLFEPIIEPTVRALKDIKPKYLMAGHCTGWRAIHRIAREMPDAFIPNSVGTTLNL